MLRRRFALTAGLAPRFSLLKHNNNSSIGIFSTPSFTALRCCNAAAAAAASPAPRTTTKTSEQQDAAAEELREEAECNKELLKALVVSTWSLPHQARLSNFVHHNPLASFEALEFTEAQQILRVLDLFPSPAEKAFLTFQIDPRKRVAEAMSEASQVFLDLGASHLRPQYRDKGFLVFWAKNELLGFAPWRRGARRLAKRVLAAERRIFSDSATTTKQQQQEEFDREVSLTILRENLIEFGVEKQFFELAVLAMLREGVRGWAGMFSRLEHAPEEGPPGVRASLLDFTCVLSILTRSSITAMINGVVPSRSGEIPLHRWLSIAPGKEEVVAESDLAISPALIEFRRKLAEAASGVTSSTPTDALPTQATPELALAQLEKLQRAREIDRHHQHPHHPRCAAPDAASATVAAPATSQNDDAGFHESSISYPDQTGSRRRQLETEFKQALLATIGSEPIKPETEARRPRFVGIFCIDDRCGSVRRYIEAAEDEDSKSNNSGNITVDTFGAPGFFNVAAYHKPLDGREKTRLAPVGLIPDDCHCVVEEPQPAYAEQFAAQSKRRRWIANARIGAEYLAFVPFASHYLTWSLFPYSMFRLVSMGFAPALLSKARELTNTYLLTSGILPPSSDSAGAGRVVVESSEFATYTLPYTTEEAAERVATLFKVIGLRVDRMPESIVLVAGHGASSINNPFSSAYNCGAASGGKGGACGRLFAKCANDVQVRQMLVEKHGVKIPDTTIFLGAEHDTTRDDMTYFEADAEAAVNSIFSNTNSSSQLAKFRQELSVLKGVVNKALARNALERCYRFMLAADTVKTPDQALEHVRTRSIDYAEVRPELNHATSAGCLIGPRAAISRGKFLDRRVFLPSYDTLSDNDAGELLERVLAPAMVVTGGINLEYLLSTSSTTRLNFSAGTKVPLNLVSGALGVMQGTNSDLRTGLPAQMHEFHTPLRQLFLVCAPIARVEAVLGRRPDLAKLVTNGWVRLIVRQNEKQEQAVVEGGGKKEMVETAEYYIYRSKGVYEKIDVSKAAAKQQLMHDKNKNSSISASNARIAEQGAVIPSEFVSFKKQREHALRVTRVEDKVYHAGLGVVAASLVAEVLFFAPGAVPLFTALSTVALSTPVLAFARRFLHGDHQFTRFFVCASTLVASFNLVALAPALSHATVLGWSLFGFSSFGLISSYSDRPSVRNNATYVFAAYRIGDMCLLFAVAKAAAAKSAAAAAATSAAAAIGGGTSVAVAADPVIAGCLIVAACLKSSQFPSTAVFARSMESPTPASALCYGGLGAHSGIVLLATTMEFWYPLVGARLALGTIGMCTAVMGSLVGLVRADRKGALAYGTASSVGALLVLLSSGALGPNTVLLLALANAAYRIVLILQAPNQLTTLTDLRAARGGADPLSSSVGSEWLYKLATILRRFDNDFHVVHPLNVLMSRIPPFEPSAVAHKLSRWMPAFLQTSSSKKSSSTSATKRPRHLTRRQQWFIAAVIISLVGFPLAPPSMAFEHWLDHLATADPTLCVIVMAAHFAFSVIAVRLMLGKVLDPNRMRQAKEIMLRKKAF